jgi:hypothetical protein
MSVIYLPLPMHGLAGFRSRRVGLTDPRRRRRFVIATPALAAIALSLVLLASGLAAPAWAQGEGGLEVVEEGGDPLVIEGKIGEGIASFSRSVRLKATGGPVDEVQDAGEGDTPARIDRSNITITPGVAIDDGDTRDVRVTVSGVEQPGTYLGTLTFRAEGDTRTPRREAVLGVTLRAVPIPDVVPEPAGGVAFQLARSASHFPLDLLTPLTDWIFLPPRQGEGGKRRAPVSWPEALRAVRGWLEPWIMLGRYWRVYSGMPPPRELRALLDRVFSGRSLYLYVR